MNLPKFQEEFLREHGNSETFLVQRLVIDVQRELLDRMRELGITQEELARRMGVSQPNVSKLLNREENMTLRSIAVLARALGMEWEPPRLKKLPDYAKGVQKSRNKPARAGAQHKPASRKSTSATRKAG